MLIKLETKSAQVKGLSFHPKRSWILASLQNGMIQLWDYRVGILLEKFEEHTGPVRGICFHSRQPLFVSGGDDCKVKLWNYQQKRCLYTLLGHLDYIRMTMFHHEHPWVVSASDDQTIRIWDWQSRACICLLTGHNHYVMSAMFHPSENLLVSASLDQTVRVWDISRLCTKKSTNSGPAELQQQLIDPAKTELFEQPSAVIKYVLEGHDHGVNWACFHPNLPLIVSAADDRQIKLWRMSESEAWEIDTCRGHHSNVSCVLFHPRLDLLISNSEDKTIRVWDTNKRTCLHTFRRSNEKFWALAFHPTVNLLAAGHDKGMVVFKLERERPAYSCHGNCLYYIKERCLRRLDFTSSRDTPVLMQIKGDAKHLAYSLSFNPTENAVLICTRSSNPDNSICDLYRLPKGESINVTELGCKQFFGLTALWIGGSNFAVLDRSGYLVIRNLNGDSIKKTPAPCDDIFYAGTGMVLLRNADDVTLFDLRRKFGLAKVKIDKCRYVVWSTNMTYIALLSKHVVTICNKKLEILCCRKETAHIKSGVWNGDVFIYSTTNHVKYIIINGDHGIIRTIDAPIYITKMEGNRAFCLDRESRPRIFMIDSTEFKFKLALYHQIYEEIVHMVRNALLVSKALIFHLQQKGYSEVALHYVTDEKTRFILALDCGKIEEALKAAKLLNEPVYWNKLAKTALIYGNFQTVELCYQRTKNFNKLLFLYLITGNLEKLYKITKIARISKQKSSQFHGALLLGDIREIVQIQKDAKLDFLAYCTAATFGLKKKAAELKQDYRPLKLDLDAKFLRPPPPVQSMVSNWPLLNVSHSFFDNIAALDEKIDSGMADYDDLEHGWVDDDGVKNIDQCGWDIDEDNPNVSDLNLIKVEDESKYLLPIRGPSPMSRIKNSELSIDHVMVGSFESACCLLHDQIGAVNFKPYQRHFMDLYGSSQIIFTWQQNVPPSFIYSQCNGEDGTINQIRKLPHLLQHLQTCYQLTTSGKFTAAIANLHLLLLQIALLQVDSKQEFFEAQQLLRTCSQYLLALKMEILRKALPKVTIEHQKTQCEMAACFTHCNLQPEHQILTLRSALNLFFKTKNYKTAASFAKRLLDLAPTLEVAQQARKILQACKVNLTDEFELCYDEYNPFDICGATYKPLYRGKPIEKCPFCDTSFAPQFKGSLCNICEVSEIGKAATGLRISRKQFK